MALRFRKSIRLAPGLRLNVGKRGLSLSAGVRGASITVGRRGTYLNASLPGTGLSTRERIGSAPSKSSRPSGKTPGLIDTKVTIELADDGAVHFLDQNRDPLSTTMIRTAKTQQGEQIRAWLAEEVARRNHVLHALDRVHFNAPPPTQAPVFQERRFDSPYPAAPQRATLGFFKRFSKAARAEAELHYQQAVQQRHQAIGAWQAAKAAFYREETARRTEFEHGLHADPDFMERLLEEQLARLEWPRETLVSLEIDWPGKLIKLDVDLPEIEDLPTQEWVLRASGYQVSVKALSATRLRQLYARHIHAIGFRLVAEAFATLPAIDRVLLSGYSQRRDPTSGRERDDYLYSVHVARSLWQDVSFKDLAHVDVIACFDRLELTRNMTKTGHFKPITPITLESDLVT